MSKLQYVDSLAYDSETSEFVLRRKYQQRNPQGGWDWCDYYDVHPERAKQIAKGVTAFFSERESCFENSMRVFLHNKRPFDIEPLYQKYYTIQFSYLHNRERLNPFKEERKSELELIKIHLSNEQQLFTESKLFYDEVMDFEVQIVEKINKAAIQYQEWVNDRIQKLKKPPIETNTFSVPVWVLYYYYLQQAKYIPFFDGQQKTKEEAMKKLITENKHEFSAKHFRVVFYAIGSEKEKDPLKVTCLKKVIKLLEEFPVAKQLAKNDLYSLQNGVTKRRI